MSKDSRLRTGVVGLGRVVKEFYPDPTADEGGWSAVDLAPEKALAKPVTLAQIKADKRFKDMALVKYARLSVQPVPAEHWTMICRLGGLKA